MITKNKSLKINTLSLKLRVSAKNILTFFFALFAYLQSFSSSKHPTSFTTIKAIPEKVEYIDNQQEETFTDSRDNKTYKIVKIGKQTWLAENLAFKTPTGCWAYDKKESNVPVYGYLYNWETAKQACPAGWHLPSDDEWKQLEMALGMSKADTGLTGFRGNVGTKLKGLTSWHSKQTESNGNIFNALPAGFYSPEDSSFSDLEFNAYFWTSTTSKPEFAWQRDLFDTFGEISRNRYKKTYGFSVRCVKD